MSDAERQLRETIRRLLTQRELSDAAFARHMKHKPAWASMFLSGKRSMKLKELDTAAALLGVDVAYLFAGQPADGTLSDTRDNAATGDLVRHTPRDIQGASTPLTKEGVIADSPSPAARVRHLEGTLLGLRRMAEDAARRIDGILASREVPAARKAVAGGRAVHSRPDRPFAKRPKK